MTRRSTILLLLAALLILSPATPATAESSPDAQKWLEKMISIYERGPFKVDYVAELDLSALGQPLSGNLTGNLVQADRTHSRVELDFDMPNLTPGAPDGSTMSILVVTDGTTVWTEMNNPALGGRQITKITLADLEEAGSGMGGGLGVNPASMDPVAQLENLTRTMDFELLEQGGGKVTLRGKIAEETRASLGMLAVPGVDGFIFELDEETGFPIEVRAEGDKPFVTMRFNNLTFVDRTSLAAGLFEYSPPEGLPVMDLGPMLKASAKP